MDDRRLGAQVRAVRLRLGWRQVDVAARADVSQSTVCRVEHGNLDALQLRVVRAVLRALDIDLWLGARWRGGEIDRVADEDHAVLVGRMVEALDAAGWLARPEVSFSIYGERGSIDLLAWHHQARVPLVIEVRSTLNSVEETLRRHDAKVRLAPAIARERFGWEPVSVAPLLALPGDSTSRRRVARDAAVLDRTYPLRGLAARTWLTQPSGSRGLLVFVSLMPRETGSRRRTCRSRVRRLGSADSRTSQSPRASMGPPGVMSWIPVSGSIDDGDGGPPTARARPVAVSRPRASGSRPRSSPG